jgi:site-specific DNA-methyltransferase (adenine-specific)
MKLLLGDCLEQMKTIKDGSVDMILADLPYGTTACKWDNVIPFEPLWQHYWRVLKPNGAVVLFGSEPFSSHLRMSQIKHYKYDWVWNKVQAVAFLLAKKQPMRQTENISVFYKRQPTYNPQFTDKDATNIRRKSRTSGGPTESYGKFQNAHERSIPYAKSYPKNLITIPRVNSSKGRIHPTVKPVALLEYLIKTYTLEGETVLDNTMGSGSTGVACVNTGRKFIGIEMDKNYFEIASKRIAEAKPAQELW